MIFLNGIKGIECVPEAPLVHLLRSTTGAPVHYGHITPVKNAERILQEIPGWEPVKAESEGTGGRVNTEDPKAKAAKLRNRE